MKTKACVLLAAALVAWGLKHHYAGARADDLWWILNPTAGLVEVLTGATFASVPGEGHLSHEHLFLIEKSCAGVNFLIAAFGMLVFALLHRARDGSAGARVLAVSLAAAYSAAVVVNAARIAIAMWLAAHPTAVSRLSATEVHRIEGIVVYFGGLVLLHAIVRTADRAVFHPAVLPLLSYYAVTVALPLVNGAARGRQFLAHAAVVLVVPPVLMILGWVGRSAIRIGRRARLGIGVAEPEPRQI